MTVPAAATEFIKRFPECTLETSVKSELFDDLHYGAIYSAGEQLYRYMLWRIWNDALPLYVLCMLNPSTAGHIEDDQTIKTVTARAKAEGYGGILVVNAFAWRDTSPEVMKKADYPVGKHNDDAILLALSTPHSFLLCAWGPHAIHLDRNKEIRCLIIKSGANPHYLKLSKIGEPEHPLYKKLELKPKIWQINGLTT